MSTTSLTLTTTKAIDPSSLMMAWFTTLAVSSGDASKPPGGSAPISPLRLSFGCEILLVITLTCNCSFCASISVHAAVFEIHHTAPSSLGNATTTTSSNQFHRLSLSKYQRMPSRYCALHVTVESSGTPLTFIRILR